MEILPAKLYTPFFARTIVNSFSIEMSTIRMDRVFDEESERRVRFEYTGIRVRDLKRSVKFYTETMGMEEFERGRMRVGGTFVQLRSKESQQVLELNYYPRGKKYYEEYVEGSELDHLAFWCRNVRRSYEKVLAGGASSAIEPWDEGGYTLAFVQDPDGIWIELIGKQTKSPSHM